MEKTAERNETTQVIARCEICYLEISPVTVNRCERCLGCIDGTRCDNSPLALCTECDS